MTIEITSGFELLAALQLLLIVLVSVWLVARILFWWLCEIPPIRWLVERIRQNCGFHLRLNNRPAIVFVVRDFFIAFHWTVPIIFLCAAVSTIFEIERSLFNWMSFWSMAVVLVILVHELGHAIACKIVEARVAGIWVGPDSGFCYCALSGNRLENSFICVSGPLAQLCVLVVALLVLPGHNSINSEALVATWWALVPLNAGMIIWNLVPWKRNGLRSDGYRILHNLTEYWVPVPVTTHLEHQLQ